MPRNRAHFTSREIREVLAFYDIGTTKALTPLKAGNAQTPKIVIASDKGRFLLKRRPRGKDDLYHVAFAHAIQSHLEQKGYSVTGMVPTKKRNDTAVRIRNHTYELFCYVEGERCNGSSPEVTDAGRKLALLHDCLSDFACDWRPLRRTYHDSATVRGHLRTVRSNKNLEKGSRELQQTAHEILVYYNHASVGVNQLGFDKWPEQIVHSDWHPGNLLYSSGQVVCVLDFDSAKIAPVITDVANGSLQFSIVGVRPNPADWPAYLDQARLANFIAGYREVRTLSDEMLGAIPDLMIEIMVAEAALPIAATGFFGHHSGLDFLKMIHRKCEWIDSNRDLLNEVIFH